VGTFTASDGYAWHYRHYSAAGSPRARLVAIHGIQSHGGWYEYSCGRLSQAGFEVFFLDRRGSGLNQQERGDTPSYQRLLADLAEFLHNLRLKPAVGTSAEIRTFLVAISWGGKLATALLKEHSDLVAGLVLLCPGFFPRIKLSWKLRLRIGLSFLVARRRLCPIPLNDPELFTASPHWQQFLRENPLSLHRATARFLIHSIRLDRYLRKIPNHVRIPVLLVLAGHDRIIDNQRTRQFFNTWASPDKEIREYQGAHHTLEFEQQPHPYLDDLISWLQRHSG
jgi:alpha-beta hydrolase superfamily lysophospholipase